MHSAARLQTLAAAVVLLLPWLCAATSCKYDIVFLLDGSESVSAAEFSASKTAALAVAQGLIARGHTARFGVAEFSSDLTTRMALDSSSSLLSSVLGATDASGGVSNLASAIFDAGTALADSAASDAIPVLVIFTDGHANPKDSRTMEDAARALNGTAVRSVVLAAGDVALDELYLVTQSRAAVLRENHFMSFEQENALHRVLRLLSSLCECSVGDVVLVLDVSESMSSSLPEAEARDLASRLADYILTGPYSMRFALVVLNGLVPTTIPSSGLTSDPVDFSTAMAGSALSMSRSTRLSTALSQAATLLSSAGRTGLVLSITDGETYSRDAEALDAVFASPSAQFGSAVVAGRSTSHNSCGQSELARWTLETMARNRSDSIFSLQEVTSDVSQLINHISALTPDPICTLRDRPFRADSTGTAETTLKPSSSDLCVFGRIVISGDSTGATSSSSSSCACSQSTCASCRLDAPGVCLRCTSFKFNLHGLCVDEESCPSDYLRVGPVVAGSECSPTPVCSTTACAPVSFQFAAQIRFFALTLADWTSSKELAMTAAIAQHLGISRSRIYVTQLLSGSVVASVLVTEFETVQEANAARSRLAAGGGLQFPLSLGSHQATIFNAEIQPADSVTPEILSSGTSSSNSESNSSSDLSDERKWLIVAIVVLGLIFLVGCILFCCLHCRQRRRRRAKTQSVVVTTGVFHQGNLDVEQNPLWARTAR
eukprot:m.302949 g.302949  ORF g.302949 m.302949 type:complete len:717 (-) comp15560_c0_seq1:144-2294(-)